MGSIPPQKLMPMVEYSASYLLEAMLLRFFLPLYSLNKVARPSPVNMTFPSLKEVDLVLNGLLIDMMLNIHTKLLLEYLLLELEVVDLNEGYSMTAHTATVVDAIIDIAADIIIISQLLSLTKIRAL